MDSWYTVAGDSLRWLYDRRIHTPATLDAAHYFPGASDFAVRWRELRAEAFAVRLEQVPRFHEVMRQQTAISANDGRDWRTFVVKAYGTEVPQNIAHCPVLAALLAKHPDVLSATFSYLAPGKHIPLHRGPFRGILRLHLGLSMPLADDGRPGAVLWIDGKPHRLGDGETLLWDDTFPHEVLNATAQMRIALLLDVRRPFMPADMALLSCLVVKTMGSIARIHPQAFG
ncbi:MAG TPA: aspartyl/asparaginyl beta-hydroxylase domain-containing protein [Rhizomicrobium sp.]|nr:aspartyl/asparaginyl beta-hydroxylase domain-containing protein [Rhizomicrobium sp.]